MNFKFMNEIKIESIRMLYTYPNGDFNKSKGFL